MGDKSKIEWTDATWQEDDALGRAGEHLGSQAGDWPDCGQEQGTRTEKGNDL